MEYLSYCGILCNECPLFIATKNNDDAMNEKLAVEYRRVSTAHSLKKI